MKLIRLKLNAPFRSLAPGFEINFLSEWSQNEAYQFNPYCLAGKNGSGKSNVLEALAAIFYHIECIYLNYRPKNFANEEEDTGFNARRSTPDAFELEYRIPLKVADLEGFKVSELEDMKVVDLEFAHISIIKKENERPSVQCLNVPVLNENDGEISRTRIKKLLPKHILGYSSGSNEILSLPFFKMRFIHFDEYYENLMDKSGYGGTPEGRLVYLDEQYSQAILLCHLLFPESIISEIFSSKLGIEGMKSFRIGIRYAFEVVREGEQNERKEISLTSQISESIEKLQKCATTQFEDENTHEILLDFWVNPATLQAFQAHFSSAIELFQLFQLLLTLNLHVVDQTEKKDLYLSESLYANEGISRHPSDGSVMRFKHFLIGKKGVKEPIYLKALSDGEHQFMHTIGLCLLYRHEQALFLLDEPETHLNPDWRASYITTLRDALDASEDTKGVMREMLLTSHSPFIISDCQPENVLIFEKNKDNQVTYRRPDFNTFGASANLITREVFGRDETIGDFAKEKLDKMVESLKGNEKADTRTLVRKIDSEFGDSVEKTMALGKLLRNSKDNDA